jgi:IS30 family transposase
MFDRHPENDWLYAYVHARLRDGWSPQQISGLKRDYPGEKSRHINHETIYRFIRSLRGVYFADPYSSWQRGSNEYHNGLLRRYLPKRTDFSNLTQEEFDDIVEEINNRPRKCLDYATPNEVFSKELTKASVRIESRM